MTFARILITSIAVAVVLVGAGVGVAAVFGALTSNASASDLSSFQDAMRGLPEVASVQRPSDGGNWGGISKDTGIIVRLAPGSGLDAARSVATLIERWAAELPGETAVRPELRFGNDVIGIAPDHPELNAARFDILASLAGVDGFDRIAVVNPAPELGFRDNGNDNLTIAVQSAAGPGAALARLVSDLRVQAPRSLHSVAHLQAALPPTEGAADGWAWGAPCVASLKSHGACANLTLDWNRLPDRITLVEALDAEPDVGNYVITCKPLEAGCDLTIYLWPAASQPAIIADLEQTREFAVLRSVTAIPL